MTFGPILPRSFYARSTVEVARALLGKVLVHGPTAGIIVETEAYLGGEDLAAHSARGLTERTRVIFGPPGHAYVYLIYGMYQCLNLVAEVNGRPGCVLIRALQPVAGVDLMRARRGAARPLKQLVNGPGKLTLALGITPARRGDAQQLEQLANGPGKLRLALGITPARRGAAQQLEQLANGPGKLTLALGITRAHNGADVTRGALVVRQAAGAGELEIAVTPRIGITRSAELPLRFLLAGSGFVSARRYNGPSLK